jgi:hypothetical protein
MPSGGPQDPVVICALDAPKTRPRRPASMPSRVLRSRPDDAGQRPAGVNPLLDPR